MVWPGIDFVKQMGVCVRIGPLIMDQNLRSKIHRRVRKDIDDHDLVNAESASGTISGLEI